MLEEEEEEEEEEALVPTVTEWVRWEPHLMGGF